METVITVITLSITNLITNIILLNFFSAKYSPRYSDCYSLIFLLCATTIMVFVNMLNNPTFNLLAYLGIFVILNVVMFAINGMKDVLINIAFFLVIFLLLDTLCYVFVETLLSLKGNVSSFLEGNLKMITSSLMQFVVYNILKNFVLRKEISSLSKKDLFSYMIVSIFSLILMGVCVTFIDETNKRIKIIFFIIAIGVMLLNVWYIEMLEVLSKKRELEENNKLMNINSKMLFNHYHNLEEKEEQTKMILHDIKNHLQVLEKSSQEAGNKDNAYLHEVEDKINELTTSVIIDRKILNILFIEKIEEASKCDIKIKFDIDNVDTSFISDFDIVTIFSNILDNAIEAVKEVHKESRVINVNIKKVNDFLLICEMNPCMNTLKKNKGKIMTSKQGHSGLGLKNIERVLKKYDANMVIEVDDTLMFSNTIMFTIY